jgi:hypothetical protein
MALDYTFAHSNVPLECAEFSFYWSEKALLDVHIGRGGELGEGSGGRRMERGRGRERGRGSVPVPSPHLFREKSRGGKLAAARGMWACCVTSSLPPPPSSHACTHLSPNRFWSDFGRRRGWGGGALGGGKRLEVKEALKNEREKKYVIFPLYWCIFPHGQFPGMGKRGGDRVKRSQVLRPLYATRLFSTRLPE